MTSVSLHGTQMADEETIRTENDERLLMNTTLLSGRLLGRYLST